MKTKIQIALFTLFPLVSFCQWKYQDVNNGLDEPYKIAYNTHTPSNVFLKLENLDDGSICLYLTNGYFCTDYPFTEVSFKIGSEWKKFEFNSVKSTDNYECIFITFDMESNADLVNAFKSANLVRIRVNDDYCGSNIYDFNMSNSANAFNFMKK